MKKEEIYSQPKVVGVYDKRRFGGKSGKWVNERELKVVHSLLPRQGRILDIPSGTGRLAKYLQSKGYRVVCADISDEMLKKTKEKIERGTKIVKASADSLPFKNSEFDAVVHLRFLFHYQGIKQFLEESKRVVKKGGLIIFDTYNWSPRALPLQDSRVYIHNKKKVEKIIEELELKTEKKVNCFIFSPLIYRFLPWSLIPLLSKIENAWPKSLLVRTFWKVKKI